MAEKSFKNRRPQKAALPALSRATIAHNIPSSFAKVYPEMLSSRDLRTMFSSLLTARRLSRLTFVFLGLGICVFAWGLQYKLSLYYPAHSTYHRVPAAKLLSKNEQPSIAIELPTEGKKKAASENLQILLIALVVARLTSLALVAQRRFDRQDYKPWLLAVLAGLDAFFFRPPPISA